MNVHLLANTYRKDAIEAAADIGRWLQSKGHSVSGERETSLRTDLPLVDDWEFGACDLVVVFGGDGSLIRAAHMSSAHSTPILGVYYGTFGFVTQCAPEEVRMVITEFLEGRSTIEERLMLEVELIRQGRTVATLHSLNETVLARDLTSRLLVFEVKVDGRVITEYPADGVLVSTPTGSTAYNLSVGGPIMDPSIEAIIVSAVAPHTLSARPLILNSKAVIELGVQKSGHAVLSVDGQSRLHLLTNDLIRIRKSDRLTRLVSVEKDDFLIKLGTRLLWNQGLEENEDE